MQDKSKNVFMRCKMIKESVSSREILRVLYPLASGINSIPLDSMLIQSVVLEDGGNTFIMSVAGMSIERAEFLANLEDGGLIGDITSFKLIGNHIKKLSWSISKDLSKVVPSRKNGNIDIPSGCLVEITRRILEYVSDFTEPIEKIVFRTNPELVDYSMYGGDIEIEESDLVEGVNVARVFFNLDNYGSSKSVVDFLKKRKESSILLKQKYIEKSGVLDVNMR